MVHTSPGKLGSARGFVHSAYRQIMHARQNWAGIVASWLCVIWDGNAWFYRLIRRWWCKKFLRGAAGGWFGSQAFCHSTIRVLYDRRLVSRRNVHWYWHGEAGCSFRSERSGVLPETVRVLMCVRADWHWQLSAGDGGLTLHRHIYFMATHIINDRWLHKFTHFILVDMTRNTVPLLANRNFCEAARASQKFRRMPFY